MQMRLTCIGLFPILSEVSDMDLAQAYDLIDATQNLDVFVAVSGAVKNKSCYSRSG